MGPIPFTAIVEYSRIYELGDFDDFCAIIQMMDEKFLELKAASKKEVSPKGSDAVNNRNKNNKGAR